MSGLNPGQEQLRRLQGAFRELKAEQDEALRQPPERRIFVHTRVYRQVKDEGRCLLIGRKGAGKTAMLVGYRHENREDYLAEADIDIIADEFPLAPLFNFFYIEIVKKVNGRREKTEARDTDLAQFLDPTKVATYAWKQSLVAAAVFMAAEKILASEVAHKLSEDEKKTLNEAHGGVLKLMGLNNGKNLFSSGGDLLSGLLVFFFGDFSTMIETMLEESTGGFAGMIARISTKLAVMAKTNTVENLRKPVQQIRQILERHQKKVLLTLDRFDDFYDEFQYRQDSGDLAYEKRTFLASLLKGLVIAARDLQRDTSNYAWMHMIFTIPMDKFLELQLRERADLESNHVVRLEWSPKELYELVNRRIAAALKLPEKEVPNAWKTLFPFDVTNARVREVKEDSFLYIVRHSLWNPREIQMYLKALFVEMEKRPADEHLFREVVRRETENIIRREFIGQFIGEFHGLQKVLNKLNSVQLRTVMLYEDLCDKLGGLELFEDCRTPDQIALRLFHMGVLGVRAPARQGMSTMAVITQQKKEVSYRFSFNSDDNDPFSPACEVCFHPMFFEYLNLKHEEPYVVNQLTWEMFE
jgi:hypothetical protein